MTQCHLGEQVNFYVEPVDIRDVSRTLHANPRFLLGKLPASCSQGWYWSTGRRQTCQCGRIIPITCVELWLELQRNQKSTNHRKTNFLVMWITNLVSTWWLFPSAVIPGNSLSVTQKRKLARAHTERLRVATEFQVFRLGVGLFFCAEVIKEQKSKESSCNQLWEGAEASAIQSVLQNPRLLMKTNWKRAYSCLFTQSGNWLLHAVLDKSSTSHTRWVTFVGIPADAPSTRGACRGREAKTRVCK